MRILVEKLDSVLLLGQGRVNILHIGGSHVQADMYTDVVRMHLDSLNNGLRPPRGFIFPYAAARTNNPFGYKVRYGGEWMSRRNAAKQFDLAHGMSGILIATTDTAAWFSISLNVDSLCRWQATRIHLLGRSVQGRARPVVETRHGSIVDYVEEPTGYLFEFPLSTDSFVVRVSFDSLQCAGEAECDTFIVTGIVPDNDEAGIVYNTIGVNGASVPSFLNCVDFERDMQLIKPDLAIFAIGINDANVENFDDSVFIANYDTLIQRIRCVSPDCALIFITNNDSKLRLPRRKAKVNRNGLLAQQAFYDLARRWRGGLWDLFEVMGGLGSMAQWQAHGLANRDNIHFTRAGYRCVGRLFFEALLDFYLDYDLPQYDY